MPTLEVIRYDHEMEGYVVVHDNNDWLVAVNDGVWNLGDLANHLSDGHPRVRASFVDRGYGQFLKLDYFAQKIDALFEVDEEAIPVRKRKK